MRLRPSLTGLHSALARTVIEHFEDRENTQGQAQYARARFDQALIYSAEGKEKMRKRAMAAARQALEEVCEELGVAEPPDDRDLVRADFEAVLDVRFI